MKQDCHRIEELIERFFEGKSSNGEEQELYAFFSGENIPEHLLPYRPVFGYFESGIKEEKLNHQTIIPKTKRLFLKKNIRIWAGIAASLLILILFGIEHFSREKEYIMYEGSYIVRNGIKITDPKIVIPEIKKTLYLAQQQEKEFDLMFQQSMEINQTDLLEQMIEEIVLQQLYLLEQIEQEIILSEFMEIIIK